MIWQLNKVQWNLKQYLCFLEFRVEYISANGGDENEDPYVQET